MKIEDMREQVAGAYPGLKWRDRVYAMEDRQIVAIFRTMTEIRALHPRKNKDDGIQTCMFDKDWTPDGRNIINA